MNSTSCNFFPRTSAAGLLYLITLLMPLRGLCQQNYLEVPVRLEVESGDMNNIVVKVKKDGNDAFTQSGASKMRLKLDFGMRYTLIFTKPGYITKTIEFNTGAPAERIAQGFQAYRIGVKLFLQNAENKVIYNQPVAQIRFDREVDDFNYETDYTSSILSAMEMEEEEDKKPETPPKPATPTPEPTRPAEPVAVAAATPTPEPTRPAEPVAVAAATPTPEPTRPAEPVTDVPPSESDVKGAKPTGAPSMPPAQPESEASSRSLTASAMAQPKAVMPAKTEPRIPVTTSRTSRIAPSGAGNEMKASEMSSLEEDKITREDIVEANRIITRITVTKRGVRTEYTRVNHKWGGVFYFRNGNQSIPENLFVKWTGQ